MHTMQLMPRVRLYVPPFVLSNERLATATPQPQEPAEAQLQCASSTGSLLLFCFYTLTANGQFMVCACNDQFGELQTVQVFSLCDPELFGHSSGEWSAASSATGSGSSSRGGASLRRHALAMLWEYLLELATQYALPVRFVVAKVGRLGHGELRTWAALFGRRNLSRASSVLRAHCHQCQLLLQSAAATDSSASASAPASSSSNGLRASPAAPVPVPVVLSACVLSLQVDVDLLLLPERSRLTDESSKASAAAAPALPLETSATHILAVPVSAVARTCPPQLQQLQPADQMHPANLSGVDESVMLINPNLGALPDTNAAGFDMSLDMGFMGFDMSQLEMPDTSEMMNIDISALNLDHMMLEMPFNAPSAVPGSASAIDPQQFAFPPFGGNNTLGSGPGARTGNGTATGTAAFPGAGIGPNAATPSLANAPGSFQFPPVAGSVPGTGGIQSGMQDSSVALVPNGATIAKCPLPVCSTAPEPLAPDSASALLDPLDVDAPVLLAQPLAVAFYVSSAPLGPVPAAMLPAARRASLVRALALLSRRPVSIRVCGFCSQYLVLFSIIFACTFFKKPFATMYVFLTMYCACGYRPRCT